MRRNHRRGLLLSLFLVPLVLLGGCGGDGRIEISGGVTLNGTPIENGTISFRPADGNGPTAEALISQGRYTVRLPAGTKSVQIQGFREIGQEHANPDDPESPMVPKTEPIVPAKYNSETTLTIEVENSTDDADFELSA